MQFANKIGSSVLAVSTIATVAAIATTPAQATTLTSFETYGDDMVGMQISANFLGGGSETATWEAAGFQAGGAFGSGWSLVQSGDTHIGPWTLSADGVTLSSLVIDAVPGNTLFDTTFPSPGTPGSSSGKTFFTLPGSAPTAFEYSVPIDISLGDLFGTLSLSWSSGFTGELSFLADTDNGTADDPVQPRPEVSPTHVPEPAAILSLLACGALGARVLNRKVG